MRVLRVTRCFELEASFPTLHPRLFLFGGIVTQKRISVVSPPRSGADSIEDIVGIHSPTEWAPPAQPSSAKPALIFMARLCVSLPIVHTWISEHRPCFYVAVAWQTPFALSIYEAFSKSLAHGSYAFRMVESGNQNPSKLYCLFPGSARAAHT